MNRKLRLPLALALALGSSHALALGLGQIEVKSSLYQPLDAQIPVLSNTPSETANLKVRLASPEDFARVGLDSSSMLSANLEFSVQKDASGKSVIHVTTDSKLNDPFVTFLLEVDWGKGRMLREFTVLLDPPLTAPISGSAAPARVPSAMEPVPSEPVVVQTMPAPEPEPPTPAPAPAASTPPPSIPAQTSPAPEPVTAAPAEPTPAPAAPAPTPMPMPAMGNEYGPTISGDTLWSIAQRVRPAGVDMNQTMLALLNANPDAFIGNNINRLKKGAVLRIPTASDMVATGLADARMEVTRQMDAWRASVGQAQPQPEVAGSRTTTPTRRETDADRSRLELVPPKGDASGNGAQSGVAANSAGTELRRDLQRAREDLGARDQEITELKSRVGELEKIETDSKRLISMQNSELARLRDRLAELEAEDAASADSAPAATDAVAGTGGGEMAADAGMDDMSADATATEDGGEASADSDEASATDANAADETEGEAAPTPTLTPPATRPQPATQPAATPAPPPAAASTPAERPAMPWYRNLWVMVGGAALLLGLIILAALRMMRGGGKKKAEPSRRVSDAMAVSAAPSMAMDDDDGMSDREIELLEALSEQPEDLDRHLELVRYYYEQGNEDAFEGAAEAMYAQCADDPGNLAWRQVVAMGREVIPDHPMFEDAEPLPPAVDDAFDAALAAEVEPAAEPEAEVFEAVAEDVPEAAEESADFSWEEPAAEAPPAPAKREEVDFGDFSEPAPKMEPVDIPPAPAPAAAIPESAPTSAGDVDEDAAATKLELARAYLDMGDVEGARGMLEEVLGEGNPGQRDEARRLLDEIR